MVVLEEAVHLLGIANRLDFPIYIIGMAPKIKSQV
jgi:hypothetical protein